MNQLERIINEIEMIHRGRPSEKFYFLQASLLFAKKHLEDNAFQYNLWDKVRIIKGGHKGKTGKIIGRELRNCTDISSISYQLDTIDGFRVEEENLEVVEYAGRSKKDM